jgi:PAS domain S-box-containing protein
MYFPTKTQRLVAVTPLVALVILNASVLLFGLGEGNVYASPDLLFALNTTFLTVSGLIIAILSAISYQSDGSLSLLLLGMATATGGVLACVAGLAANISVDYNVAIFNLGFLLSGGFQFLSAILNVAGAFPTNPERRKHLITLGYLLITFFIFLLSALVLGGFAPTFFAVTGPTAIRQWIIGAGTLFFVASSILFGWQYLRTKSRVLFWYALALAFMALSLFSLAVYKTPNSVFNWTGRVAYFVAGFYFLIAVVSARRRMRLDVAPELGVSGNWADAFRSKLQFETLFSQMLNGFAYQRIVVDKDEKPVDYVFLSVNDAFEKMTGLRRKAVVGKRVTEVLLGIEKDPADWIGVYGRVALTGVSTQFENYSQALGRWYNISAYSPEKGYFITLFEDITTRKKAENEIKHLNEQFEMAQRASGIGVWDWDIMTGHIDWTAEMFRLFGLDPQKTVAGFESWTAVIHPEDREKAASKINEALKNHSFLDNEYRVVRPNGRIIWINALGQAEYDENNQPIRMSGICIDFSERKKAEDALKESEQYYRSLIENSDDGFQLVELIYDDSGKVYDFMFLKVNQAYERQTGLQASFVVGRRAREFAPDLEQYWYDAYDTVDKTGKTMHMENYNQSLKRWFDVYQISFGKGKLGSIFRDVTERKNLEKQLKDSERMAAIGLTAGMVGHDIRNPLQAITSDVYLAKTELSSTPESDEKNNALTSLIEIEKNIDYINKIVQDLQD